MVSSDRKPSPQHQLPVKPGFGASLTGNLNFERKFFVGSLPVKSRPACSFLRWQQCFGDNANINRQTRNEL
jgi:hypothetical protein